MSPPPPKLKARNPGAARQVISQRLTILPCGIIRGGTLGYSCHPETGELHYAGEIRIHGWFYSKRHRFHGTINVSPFKLRSKDVSVGNVIHCRRLKITVETVNERGCDVLLDFSGAYPGLGSASFDLSGEYVRLIRASGDGIVRCTSIFKGEHVHLMVEDGDRDT